MTACASSAPAAAAPVSELFCSFQGEGPSLGRRALFARFMGCNLTCGYSRLPGSAETSPEGLMLCDTEYTWNGAKHDLAAGVEQLTAEQVWDRLMALDPSSSRPEVAPVDLIVASGGEPMLHQHHLVDLAKRARRTGRVMEIETNATIAPSAELIATGVHFNAGLKLGNTAIPRKRRIKEGAITALQASGRARWKFVICRPEDLSEVKQLQRAFGLTEVWLSPEGRTGSDVIAQMRHMADAALAGGWNLTTRQHVLIWGDERAR